MSEIDATLVKNGQKVVATVSQSGTIISDPSAVDATALVQTDDGPQLCVKTFDLNGGGGGGGTVDQTYDPTSTNAQSGTAVAEAVQPYLKNTATATDAIVILGKPVWGSSSITIGKSSRVAADSGIAIGNSAYTYNGPGVSIGSSSETNSSGVAIGLNAKAKGTSSIQLGTGTNSTANSFQVFTFPMLDGTTGKIPMARLPIVQCTQAEYDALVSGGTVDANTIYCIIPA